MTPYLVDWTDAALNMLANVWTQTTNRASVNAAQNRIDALLARDPIGNGIHLGEGLYKADVSPLTVYYSVHQAKKSVEVSAVKYSP